MSRAIKLRSPEVSEEYTEWINKSTAFDREYYNYNAPDEYREFFRADLFRGHHKAVPEFWDNEFMADMTAAKLLPHLLKTIPLISPDDEYLIDSLCNLLAACIKYPDAIIETY